MNVVVALKFLGFKPNTGGSHAFIPCKDVKTFGVCERCLQLLLSLSTKQKQSGRQKGCSQLSILFVSRKTNQVKDKKDVCNFGFFF